MMYTKIDAKASVGYLHVILSDLTIFSLTARNIHWNMQGPNFIALHELFEEIYKDMSEKIDETAEHIRILGFAASADVATYVDNATIKSIPEPLHDVNVGLDKAISQLTTIIQYVHTAIENLERDPIRQDFCISLAASLEKTTRLIRSHRS